MFALLERVFSSKAGTRSRQTPPLDDDSCKEAMSVCLSAFDDATKAVGKAWSGGAMKSRINPQRVQRVSEAFEQRDPRDIASLVVEIAMPDNAVSVVAQHQSEKGKHSGDSAMREFLVRGVMGALLQAVVEIECALHDGAVQAQALKARLRNWIQSPLQRQASRPGSPAADRLEHANDALCMISQELARGQSACDAAKMRLGMAGPLAVALQIIEITQEGAAPAGAASH